MSDLDGSETKPAPPQDAQQLLDLPSTEGYAEAVRGGAIAPKPAQPNQMKVGIDRLKYETEATDY